jgi:hypothetical protein
MAPIDIVVDRAPVASEAFGWAIPGLEAAEAWSFLHLLRFWLHGFFGL